MNMTVVLISKRSIEMHLLLVCCLLFVGGPGRALCGHLDDKGPTQTSDELPQSTRVIVDESRPLDDELLDSIVKEYSASVKMTMDSEMDKLIAELEGRSPSKGDKQQQQQPEEDNQLNEEHLNRLKRANEQASDEIKTRIELASDTSGALPQWSPGQAAAGLVSAASSRLQAVGSFTGDKLRSLATVVARKVPAKLRRFFRWPSFSAFRAKFHKDYSAREELYRQMIYLRNQVVVGIQRVRFLFRRDKHITKATQFADWTKEEYEQVHNNREAETKADAEQLEQLSESSKAKLEQLAKTGKNVFGEPIELPEQVAEANKRKAALDDETFEAVDRDTTGGDQKRRRNKREAGEDGEGEAEGEEDDYDELADSEEDLELILGDEDTEDPPIGSEEEFKLLEEFSNANLDEDLEDVSDVADEALALNSDFKRIDLRETGCIIESDNQDNCGNCYTHVVVVAATYYRCMASQDKSMIRFHSRFLSDCGRYLTLEDGSDPQIKGCRGGRMSHAFWFAQTVGVQRYGEYQCARMGGNWKSDDCAYAKPTDIFNTGWKVLPVDMFKNSRFIKLQLGEVDLHLRTIGPVFCNIRVWEGFKDFGGGIYDGFDDKGKNELHSVLMVGHDIDSKGRHYYIFRNSHGINWGEDGFFRIYNESLNYFGQFYAGLAPQTIE